jgi:hypothetical protein
MRKIDSRENFRAQNYVKSACRHISLQVIEKNKKINFKNLSLFTYAI